MVAAPRDSSAPSRLTAYTLALAAVTLAVLIRWSFDPWLADRAPFVTLFAAVVFATWYGGRGPGVLAMIAGAAAVVVFIIQPHYTFADSPAVYLIALTLYTVVNIALIAIIESQRRASTAAAEAAEALKTTLLSIGDAVITTDAHGRVASLNVVAERMTGWTHAEASGQPLDTVFHIVNEDTRQAVENPATRALREGVVVGLANHTVLIARDGTERAIDDSAAPIQRNGVITGCVLVFRDMTARRQHDRELEGREAQFRTLAESIPQLAWMANPDGFIFWYNRRWYDYTGTTLEQMQGDGWRSVHHPDELPAVMERWRASIETGTPFDMVFPLKGTDGVFRPFLTRVVPVKDADGKVARWFGTNTDITEQKRTEQQLQRNHDSFFELIQNNPFGVYVVDADFRLRQVSKGAQKVFEHVRPLLGRDFDEVLRILWPEPFVSEAIARFQHTLATGEPYSAPSTQERREDTEEVEAYDWRIERIGLPDGRYGVVCYFYDLSERRRWEAALRASEGRLRLATEAARLGIWSWEPERDHVVWENDRPHQIMGVPPDETAITAARFATEFVHPDDRAIYESALQRTVRDGAPFLFEGRIRRPDGEQRWIEFTGALAQSEAGEPVRVLGTVEDITARKQAEVLLVASDRRKDEFLAILAHELRNPLAPVTNSLELMKRAQGDQAVVEQARATMERQVAQMVRLIDDLLDISRITLNKIELKTQRVEVASIVHHALEAFRPDVERAGQDLRVCLPATPIYLDADPARLMQVLGNLLTNAGKYTEPGGRISLTAEMDGAVVTITVADTGVGIPADMLPEVFDLFTQVDRSLERSHSGLGIGLSLVKRLVELHGGTVTVDSEGIGCGSRFVVRLPVAAVHAAAAPVPAGATAGVVPHRILVVDDNQDSADSLRLLLQLTGHVTETARDGIEALEKAAMFRPDVILLDIGLPRLNGYDTCRAIREQPWGRDILIVALTGWGQEEDRQKSRQAGFNAHLVKPLHHDALTTLLAAHARETRQ